MTNRKNNFIGLWIFSCVTNLPCVEDLLKLHADWLKCNIDAAVFTQEGYSGFGWVLRDAAGVVIAAKNGVLSNMVDPLLAEAMSCREALSWLKNWNLNKIIVESDALEVIKAIQDAYGDCSYFGAIIDDCKVLSKDLESCVFKFVRLLVNRVAHTLASVTGSESDRGE